MTSGGDASKPKPDGAWTAEQTVEYAFEKIGKGDFYAICPDNDVKEELDQLVRLLSPLPSPTFFFSSGKKL
jgi:hypothetical protein